MSILATTSATVNSALNAVATVADTTARTISTASTGLDMLDMMIRKAKAKQVIDHALEMDTYQEEAIAEASANHQQKMESILRQMHSDPIRKQHFDAIHSRLSALFEPKP
jgi:hypothetical protein